MNLVFPALRLSVGSLFLAASLHPTTRAYCPLAGVSQSRALRGQWQCLAALGMGRPGRSAVAQVKCVR